MSIPAIQHYHNAIAKIFQYSGASHEQAIKDEFKKLINVYCEKQNLLLVSEISEPVIDSKNNKLIKPDGIVFDWTQSKRGYWESKATDKIIDLEKEIFKKINAGYSLENIVFQDKKTVILYRNDKRFLTADLKEERELDKLLTEFVNYESKETKEFLAAVEQFKTNLPPILARLRLMISEQEKSNPAFLKARAEFLTICQNSINPDITIDGINEMLIQHILTEEIFISVFSDAAFHQDNNIAKELYKVETTFFTGKTKKDTLADIQGYYAVIKAKAVQVHHKNKQTFLKAIYENFYKIYNPKEADKLGIVYTPDEIVKFQLESVDYLLGKHFGKVLADKDIKILDPCTGTGTYICALIEYLPQHRLVHKYEQDIYANELGLLPYYIANLNIEYTYQQKMGSYAEFKHICWVDTLDNTGFGLKDSNTDLFGLSVENTERIKKQNSEKISVIIGNPPYNAKQENYNNQNANRFYKDIDSRIKETYIKHGTAQNQIVVYDMYTRFYRWASERLDKEQGIIAFITNNSFINSRAFDGFRQCISNEFDFAYIVDTRSDVRMNPKIAGTTHNVFGIQTGVALMFLVKAKNNNKKPCKIFYTHLADEMLKSDKLAWFSNNKLEKLDLDFIIPDKNNNWINQTDNDFNDLMPLVDKDVKAGKGEQAIFKLFSRGIATQRDEWVYDFDKNNLENKIKFFVNIYQSTLKNSDFKDKHLIKFDRELDKYLERKISKKFEKIKIIKSLYRPFLKQNFYFDKNFNGMTYQWFDIYNIDNKYIAFNAIGGSKDFHCLASNTIIDLHLTGDSQCLTLYVYDKDGNRHDNITDWALNEFNSHYNTELTKLDIFHYVYAVLHNPDYRKKYELNLKREFPRIPYYENFAQWAEWGKQLMDLHLNYETVDKYPLQRHDSEKAKIPKAKLKADKENGLIILDDNTQLSGVPSQAWDYKLGNRSALEWILDQYKEKTPKDKTIAEKFNTYRFADYKEQVIDLLMRVCTVSVETVKIVNQLATLNEITEETIK